MKRIVYIIAVTSLLFISCGSQSSSKSVSEFTISDSTRDTIMMPRKDEEPNNDERICKAIRNFLLGKPDAAVLTHSAKKDLTESTWPEVYCSIEGMLDSPRYFKDLQVKKVGEGMYKYSCVCPDHGDKFTDCCTIHATLGSDGIVRIEHVTWDESNNVSLSDLLRDASWYDTEYGFRAPNFMTPSTEIFVDDVPASVQYWIYNDICLACWPLLGAWAVDDFPAPEYNLTENVRIKNITNHNGAGTLFSGYATDGRIWYMKKKIIDGEIPHAKALILLYPKEMQNEVKTFIDIVKRW